MSSLGQQGPGLHQPPPSPGLYPSCPSWPGARGLCRAAEMQGRLPPSPHVATLSTRVSCTRGAPMSSYWMGLSRQGLSYRAGHVTALFLHRWPREALGGRPQGVQAGQVGWDVGLGGEWWTLPWAVPKQGRRHLRMQGALAAHPGPPTCPVGMCGRSLGHLGPGAGPSPIPIFRSQSQWASRTLCPQRQRDPS